MAKILHEFGFKIQGCIDKQERLYGMVTRNGNILQNRRNEPKDTPARRKSKARTKFAGTLMRAYKSVCQVGYPKLDPSAKNIVSRPAQFLKLNTTKQILTDASSGEEYKWTVNTAELTLARAHGGVPMAAGVTLSKASNKVTATWGAYTGVDEAERKNDKVALVLIPEGKPLEAIVSLGNVKRDAGQVEVGIPSMGTFHAYLFFYAENRGASEQVVKTL